MKIHRSKCFLLIAAVIFLSSCTRNELKEDAKKISDLLCRNLEILNKMQITKPQDSLGMRILKSEGRALQDEMEKRYRDFRLKYPQKIHDTLFVRKFNRELHSAMLKCPYLSKEDKERFEKELRNP